VLKVWIGGYVHNEAVWYTAHHLFTYWDSLL